MTIGTDTLIFGAIAVLCAAWLIVTAWCRHVLRKIEDRENASLSDDDMRDEDEVPCFECGTMMERTLLPYRGIPLVPHLRCPKCGDTVIGCEGIDFVNATAPLDQP